MLFLKSCKRYGIEAEPRFIYMCWMCSRDVLFRVTILAEWLRHFIDLAVGETAAPAGFSRENAEGAGMPPLLSL
jgi:hypothetical protein